jgi:hypothetical protein
MLHFFDAQIVSGRPQTAGVIDMPTIDIHMPHVFKYKQYFNMTEIDFLINHI